MKSHTKFYTGIAACLAAVISLMPSAAMAQEPDEYRAKLQELSEITETPASIDEIDQYIRSMADEKQISYDDVLDQALVLLREAKKANELQKYHGSGFRSAGSLGNARYAGDIFYTPTAPFGHVGIFHSANTIIEAPGYNQVSRKTASNSIYILAGGQLMSVATSVQNRSAAASYASTMLNRSYPLVPMGKSPNGPKYCSELVWAAYKYTTGIDLDPSPNDILVTPADIRDSRFTSTYKWW